MKSDCTVQKNELELPLFKITLLNIWWHPLCEAHKVRCFSRTLEVKRPLSRLLEVHGRLSVCSGHFWDLHQAIKAFGIFLLIVCGIVFIAPVQL